MGRDIEKARELASILVPEDQNNGPLVDLLSEMAMWKDSEFRKLVKSHIKLAYDSGQRANLLEDLLKEI